MWHKVIVMIVTFEVTYFPKCASEPLSGNNNKWSRPTFSSQDYSGYFMSIDQRLRNIDSIRPVVSRTEISVQSLSNRMDLIETRLQTIQSSLQHTLEAVKTAVKSSEMKYELLFDQLSRKVESGFDHISHRLNSIETRGEGMINKLQNQMDLNFGRIDNKQSSIGNDVVRVSNNLDVIRNQITKQEENSNQTFQILYSQFQEVHFEHGVKREHLKNISSLLVDLNNNKSEMNTQNDAQVLPEEGLKMLRTEISNEAHKISAKWHNMYNDLWRTIKDLEVTIRSGFEENNSTSKDLYNRLSELLEEEQKHSEGFMDVVMQSVLSSVADHLNGFKMQIDNRFNDFEMSQRSNGESCYQIKNIIENRVALILEKIYDTFINRTEKFSKQIIDVAELTKSQKKQLAQATAEIKNSIVTFAEETTDDHKRLDNAIIDVSETCQDLQIQPGDEIYLRLREIKNILLLLNENIEVYNKSKEPNSKKIHAIEANFSNGVINIKTNSSNIKLDEDKEDELTHVSGIPFETLNKTISTEDLVAVISEPLNNKKNEDEDGKYLEGDDDEDDDFDAQEEMSVDEVKPVDTTQLLSAYIKLLRSHLSSSEFLMEAIPGASFETFEEMIKYLKKAGNVPRETIHDIELYAAEQQNFRDPLQTETDIGRILRKLRTSSSEIDSDDDYEDEEEEAKKDFLQT